MKYNEKDRKNAVIEAEEILARKLGLYKLNPDDTSYNYDMDLRSFYGYINETFKNESEKIEFMKYICTELEITMVHSMDDYEKSIQNAVKAGAITLDDDGTMYSYDKSINALGNIVSICYIEDQNTLYFSNGSYLKYSVPCDPDTILDRIIDNVHPTFVRLVKGLLDAKYMIVGSTELQLYLAELTEEQLVKGGYTLPVVGTVKGTNKMDKPTKIKMQLGCIINIYRTLMRFITMILAQLRIEDADTLARYWQWVDKNNIRVIGKSYLHIDI